MDSSEIVKHEMQRNGMALILNLFTEGIGQSSHPSHAHPHRKILPLNKAG